MKPFLALVLCNLAGFTASAQSAPALAIDAKASVHPISPYVYGINEWGDTGLMELMRIPLVRWGGDDATAYNWQTNIKNNTGDNPWCFLNYSVSPGFDQVHTRSEEHTSELQSLRHLVCRLLLEKKKTDT